MSQPKPKFKVGQMVCVKPKWMHQGRCFKIMHRRWNGENFEYIDRVAEVYVECALRPITKREYKP